MSYAIGQCFGSLLIVDSCSQAYDVPIIDHYWLYEVNCASDIIPPEYHTIKSDWRLM